MDGTNSFGLAVMGVPGEMTQEAMQASKACVACPVQHPLLQLLPFPSKSPNKPSIPHHRPSTMRRYSSEPIHHRPPKNKSNKIKGSSRERERERKGKKEIENGAP